MAEEYKLHKSIIKFWISTYESERGDGVDIEKRAAELKKAEPLQMKENKKREPIVWYVATLPKESRTKKIWTKEVKLEIVKKNLVQHIPQNALAKEYGVPAGNISRWVSEYQRYGETAFEDKRLKNK